MKRLHDKEKEKERGTKAYLEGQRATSWTSEEVSALLVGGVVLDAIRWGGDGALSVLQGDGAPRVVPNGMQGKVTLYFLS